MSFPQARDGASYLSPPPRINTTSSQSPSASHRGLRKLQSAHNLRSAHEEYRNSPSSVAHVQQQYRAGQPERRPGSSPVRRDLVAAHGRTRSNSDAPVLTAAEANLLTKQKSPIARRMPTSGEMFSVDRLIRDGPTNGDVAAALDTMRLKILDQGIKSDGDGMSTLRIYIWLILLNAPVLGTDIYLELIHRGASPAYSKIRNDTFRTLTTDPLYRRRVSEASLIRLLNAVAWKMHDLLEEQREAASKQNCRLTHKATAEGSPELSTSTPIMKSRARALTLTTEGSEAGASEPGVYVQGMNVLAAPFLYAARSEAEAFTAFYRFITNDCPGYVRGAMSGVHKGVELVDKVLAIVDPRLSAYLVGKGMTAHIYAFPSVLTLCACTPPLPEVLKLWDFLFAYGAHLNILCIVAQLVILRNQILSSPSPTKILRSFPPLQAELIKQVTVTLIRKIPDDVYAEIVIHAK